MKPAIDYTLYLCTDRSLMTTETLDEAVEQAIEGGCTLVQLREKDCSSADFYETACHIKAITDAHGVPLIINDRLDIAQAINAAGVHLGQSDLPCQIARRILGPDKIIGISVATLDEAVAACLNGADYLGVGAMFPTGTKKNARHVSIPQLTLIHQTVTIPIVAIGGINTENAASLHGRCDGLAVVSAILAQPDIRKAAEELKRIFCESKEEPIFPAKNK